MFIVEDGEKISTSETNNVCMTPKETDGFQLRPVALLESGEGLPYAPVDWPNPGDIWTWKVGRRVKASGNFQDRYLIAPTRLQENPRKKMWFLSKLSLQTYIKTNFPEADINAFFSSFVWEVPADFNAFFTSPEGKAEPKPISQSPSPGKARKTGQSSNSGKARKTGEGGGTSSRKRKSNVKQQGRYLWKKVQPNISNTDVLVIKEETVENNEAFESPPVSDDNATITPLACQQVTPEDFDNYISSLDDILLLPLQRSPSIISGSRGEKEMTDSRKKLVNVLRIGFPALFTSDKLTEVTTLSLELQNEPDLSDRELSMLKLIQEIPLASNDFLEAKRVVKEADKFFAGLEAKLTRVTTLRDEYNASKQEIALLEVEDISTSSAIQEIDEKIAVLQSRRAALAKVADRTNKKMAEAKSKQRKVMGHLPKIVDEIQVANSQSSEWKLKKQKSAEKEVEILTKFAPLRGFSI
ncbi:uncharacterized protein LOC132047176 isoform X1 [Lycium ferocissimum]|uniref:uncharacterized protein LOC132047176 isoform X1 n=1 Tax=Lycium ferocissimum TaxID=112874 RepID=UPI002814C3EA|nr:uncharacterized protein LOC132047176 isoform X1 [Lycium ferocissimum]